MSKWNKFTVIIICLLFLLPGFLSYRPAHKSQPERFDGNLPTIADWRSQRFLLTFAKAPDRKKLASQLGIAPQDVQVKSEVGVAIVSPPDDKVEVVKNKAKDIPGASFEIDEPVKIFATPNDPQFSQQQTYLDKIRVPTAWDVSKGRQGVVIAIVDTGVNGTHEDLSGKVIAGHNYVNSVSIAANTDSDDHGHGTEVAGAAAAVGDNSLGIAGVDWNARIMPVKVLNNSGEGATSDAVNGITYAADNGATIINMSFGRSTESAALKSAIEHAKSKGAILVAASGNDGVASVAYPAAYDEVIAVGSVDNGDNRASFSNYGPALDVVAPGISIRTTSDSSNGYLSVSGTSMSAPLVSGGLGLIKDIHNSYSTDELKNILLENTEKISAMGSNNRIDDVGYGVINIYKALSTTGDYKAEPAGWSSSDGDFVYPSVLPGGIGTNLVIKLKNTGKTTWAPGIVNLGTARERDRVIAFLRESGNGSPSGWVAPNRVKLKESSVSPGSVGSFSFWVQAPAGMASGSYREYFEPVADGVTWFPDLGIYWDVKVLTLEESFKASPVEWSSSDGAFTYPKITRGGNGTNMIIKLKNTGKSTWRKGTVNLGSARERDRIPGFVRESGTGSASGWVSPNRVTMQEQEVAPGQTGTFSFWLRALADKPPGVYREYFAPVADGITWFSEDLGIYWDITVQ